MLVVLTISHAVAQINDDTVKWFLSLSTLLENILSHDCIFFDAQCR